MKTLKRITGLTLAALLTISMVAGGVWAYLSDIETSSNNVLLAGTLDLSPTTSGTSTGNYTVTPGGDQVNGKIVFQKMLPGDTGNITWVLADTGSIAGTLALSSNVTFSDVSQNEVETAVPGNNGGGNGDLDAYVGVKLQRGVGTDQASAIANFTYILGSAGSYAAFSGLQAVLNAQSIAIAASGGNDTVVYKLSWEINSLFGGVNDNIIQSDNAQIDITFALNQ
ncbi:MAG: TasA family protein [Dehalococcoidales bacterium]|nr:TasA family protein [Dehalococcoidales bacterium]